MGEDLPVAGPSLSTWQSLKAVGKSWRLASVSLLSFASGLPLGLVWIAIPTWMTKVGVDIKVVGLFTIATAPWSFKFLWSPLMDRYPLPLLGRKRGWILVSQIALVAVGLWLAGVSDHPDAVWVIGALTLAMAFASATQDIAIDGYAVEVLRKEEHGAAVGARTALYRAAMFVSGGVAITLAGQTSWKLVNLVMALVYVPFLFVTWKAPEPEALPAAPASLRDAVWGPFISMLGQHRALQILAFVILFKLSDNLTQALQRPFLVQVGFSDMDVGVATATIGLIATLAGTFLGGVLTNATGLGPALWITGVLQMVSNLGYAVVAQVGPNRPVMYAATGFEMMCSGLGTGAFGVLLLRLTEKRFSATQYALLSSLFSLPRILGGPVAGVAADTMGWRDFFIATVPVGIPGMLMLMRFVPWGVREPVFHVAVPRRGQPLTPAGLWGRAVMAGLAGSLGALATVAALSALRTYRKTRELDFSHQLVGLLRPEGLGDWTTLAGLVALGLTVALAAAASLAARRGVVGHLSPEAAQAPLE
jgi:MFS transporter, PAT family, beta-lactamase induction signal transducer AmpG